MNKKKVRGILHATNNDNTKFGIEQNEEKNLKYDLQQSLCDRMIK